MSRLGKGSAATVTDGSIVLDKLTHWFPGKGRDAAFHAVGPVELEIPSGQFVSIVGPSGCGKSTLMLICAGLLRPSLGSVRIGGQSLNEPLTDVGIVFQDHLLLPFRTAWDNVMLQADIRGTGGPEMTARAERLFDQLKLVKKDASGRAVLDARGRYPAQLSGGMQQRVSIARALVHNPPIIMMDEPFGALDALTRLQVRADLEQLWLTDRPTVLFITHSVEEAVGLSDRVLVMSPTPGQVVRDMTIDIPRPRPLSLTEAPELREYMEEIYQLFEDMGVIETEAASRP